MAFIYALKLEEGKYYVGRSNHVENRIQQHQEEQGSSWTSKYKLVEVLFIKESTSCFDEDKYTKELMMNFGVENVRGGNYTTIYLEPAIKALLQKEIWGAKDLCVRCGRDDHFINECHKKIDVNGTKIEMKSIAKRKTKPKKPKEPKIEKDEIDIVEESIEKEVEKKVEKEVEKVKKEVKKVKKPTDKKPKIRCKKCHRNTHTSNSCYATTTLEGEPIVVKPCSLCGKKGHKRKDCYRNK